MLTPKQEKQYFRLLFEYRDLFAWGYKEMSCLDPKITVHNLAIRNGVLPKKQPQQHFHPQLIPDIEQEVNKLIDIGFMYEVKYLT